MNEVYTLEEASLIAEKLLTVLPIGEKATVVGLTGDLGAGKTTLVQALGNSLGITQTINSPTFVIAKYYDLVGKEFEQLVHIDAYRIEEESELGAIGWKTLLEQPKTLIIVEWPERIKNSLPPSTKHFHIKHRDTDREIKQI